MKSRLAIYTLLVPLSFSVALHAADDSPIMLKSKGEKVPENYEAIPSNGIVVAHTLSLKTPKDMPKLNTGEIYTTFPLQEDEAGIAYCLSGKQATVKKYDQKDQVKETKVATGPFFVRAYDRDKNKEVDCALTIDGFCSVTEEDDLVTTVIDHNYKLDDTNLSKETNVVEVQLGEKGRVPIQRGKFSQACARVKVVKPTAFAPKTETNSTEWVRQGVTNKGRREYILKKLPEAKHTPFASPQEVSTQIMSSGSTKLRANIEKNLVEISELEQRISKLEEENAGDAAALHPRLTGVFASMRQMSNKKPKFGTEKRTLSLEQGKKELLEKQKQELEHAFKRTYAVILARDNFEQAILNDAQDLIKASHTAIKEYGKETSYLTQYTSGLVYAPSVMSSEDALKKALENNGISNEEQKALMTKLLPAVNDGSKKEKTVDKLSEKRKQKPEVKAFTEKLRRRNEQNKNVPCVQSSQKKLSEVRKQYQTEHTATLEQWTNDQADEANKLEKLEMEINDINYKLETQSHELEKATQFVASVLPALIGHYKRRGLSEDEYYKSILFQDSTNIEEQSVIIAHFKEAVAERKEAKKE